jgi:chromosome segregation ATPase
MGDFLAPPESRRWPWILAIIASLAWAAAILATWGSATGAIAVSAKLQPLLLMLAALAGPVGVALLAAVQLRDAGAVNAARAAIADARASQAAEWLEHSAESLTRLEEQLASATARMGAMEAPVANHSSAIAGVASALDSANDRLSATVAKAVSASTDFAGAVPVASSQAEALSELMTRVDNQLRSQLAETETLLASLYTRASEAEAEARAAAQASRGEINALAQASQSGLEAMANAAAQAREAVETPIGALNAAIDDAFTRTSLSVEQTRDAVHAQTSAMLASVDQARTALAHIGGEGARELDERLAKLQLLASKVAGEIEVSGRNAAALVDELGSRVEALETRLAAAIASNSEALSGLDARLAAANVTVAGFTAPLGDADAALAAVQLRLEAMGSEAGRTIALFEAQLPAGESQVSALRGQIAGLEAQLANIKEQAATLAEPLESGSATLNDASNRLTVARETLTATTDELADAIARAQEQMRALEDDTSRLSLTASGDLIETFARVREVADNAAGAMRTALAGVILEAEEALDRAAISRTEAAFAAPIRDRIEELMELQGRAGESAQAAAERVAQRLIGLARTLSDVEAHVDAVETRAEVRIRTALGRRANGLIDSLQSSAIDLAKLLDYDIDDKTWADYAAGDASAIARRLAHGLDSGAGRQFVRHYTHDAEFRTEASRYLQEFESLVADVVPERGGEALGATLLSSTLGKLYLAIGQAAGRFN